MRVRVRVRARARPFPPFPPSELCRFEHLHELGQDAMGEAPDDVLLVDERGERAAAFLLELDQVGRPVEQRARSFVAKVKCCSRATYSINN